MADSHQRLIPDYPRYPLAHFPTPLQRADRLERALREQGAASVPCIYIKRDDLLDLALGGNKIRNLEFLLGEALALSSTDVITAGRQQSNHCRLTAAACAKAGLTAHVVLSGAAPPRPTGNLLLTHLLNARIHYVGSDDRDVRQARIDAVRDDLTAAGRKPYVIGIGGSSARGAIGHVLLAGELMRQCDAEGMHPTAIVLATATGGTQAGLLAGLHKLARKIDVVGFAVAKSADELRAEVAALATVVGAEIGVAVDSEAVVVDGRALGDGYGAPTAVAQSASELLARTEGMVADPVYTGKGLAGLLALIAEGRFSSEESVVFLHTGGAPALFA